MEDFYKPPESIIQAEASLAEPGDISVFKRWPTYYVVILSIFTLGLYMPYWLYTRTKILNQVSKEKISLWFAKFVVFYWLGTYVLVVIIPIIEEFEFSIIPAHLAGAIAFADLISNILFIVWVFIFRNRLRETFSSSGIRLGFILTFILQIYYLQYKLNELIDLKSGLFLIKSE